VNHYVDTRSRYRGKQSNNVVMLLCCYGLTQPIGFGLFRHRHGKEVLSEETGRGKEVIERREVFDMQGIG
jgi:hypothetical protein